MWATDAYETIGENYLLKSEIKKGLISVEYGNLIQPRVIKSKEEQLYKTRDKVAVFTPLSFIKLA